MIVSCIDPYTPRLGTYMPVMVVEGLITNENRSYTVSLSYSMQNIDSVTKKVTCANVFITDASGIITQLTESAKGTYKSDSLTFRGEIGNIYTLHIKTDNGKEYVSNPCTMLPVPDIDTVYWAKDEQTVNNNTTLTEGISIYLDSKPGSTDKFFLRWDYSESWKFKVPYPVSFIFINEKNIVPIPPDEIKEYCWKFSNSSGINVKSLLSGLSESVKKQPVRFIATDESDRLTVRYSINVKQYSLSQQEYDFWSNLEKTDVINGDIFGIQPFEVPSNIKNIHDSTETIIGYFSVSAASGKRIYINYADIYPLNLPNFSNSCLSWALDSTMAPEYNPLMGANNPTMDDFYHAYLKVAGIIFVAPVNDPKGKLVKLIYSTFPCSDCELTGSFIKPPYWTDN